MCQILIHYKNYLIAKEPIGVVKMLRLTMHNDDYITIASPYMRHVYYEGSLQDLDDIKVESELNIINKSDYLAPDHVVVEEGIHSYIDIIRAGRDIRYNSVLSRLKNGMAHLCFCAYVPKGSRFTIEPTTYTIASDVLIVEPKVYIFKDDFIVVQLTDLIN